MLSLLDSSQEDFRESGEEVALLKFDYKNHGFGKVWD